MADNFTDTFTKEETIKALRCCYSDEGLCSICPYENTITSCTQLLKRDAFDIIKSQSELISKIALDCLECKKAKIKLFQEFAEKLKNRWFDKHYDSPDIDFDDFIDNLLKEMVDEIK